MTNPDNAIGTNAAYDGRTSVNAFNDDLASYSAGILSGWDCVPNTGLTVSLGGGSDRDVAIAEDNNGNKTTINNISGSAVDVTMSAAPASNTRIDVIVAYVDNPPQGNSTTADNPDACGIIPVSGTPSATPVPPNDSAIRTAITADGASGTTAYYVVLAQITITTGTTDITAGDIEAGTTAYLNVNHIQDASITANKLDFTTYKVLFSGTASSSVTLSEPASNYDAIIVWVKDAAYSQIGSAIVYGSSGGVIFSASGGGYVRQIQANINVSGSTVSLNQRFIVAFFGNEADASVKYETSGCTIQKVVGLNSVN